MNFGSGAIGQIPLNHYIVSPVSKVSNTVDFTGRKPHVLRMKGLFADIFCP